MKGASNIMPQQVTAGVAAEGRVLLVRDSSNSYYELNLEGLNSLMMVGEWLWTTNIVDARNAAVTVTVPIATAAGLTFTGDVAVPAGEVWIIRSFSILAPANDATGTATWNVRIPTWPAATVGANGFFAVRRAPVASQTEFIVVDSGFADDSGAYGTENAGFRTAGLGVQLRIPGPATITFDVLTATAAFTAAYALTFTCLGRKVNKVTA